MRIVLERKNNEKKLLPQITSNHLAKRNCKKSSNTTIKTTIPVLNSQFGSVLCAFSAVISRFK